MVISRLSSLEALLSLELDRSQISALWNTFVVATKGLLRSRLNSILSPIFSRPLWNWAPMFVKTTHVFNQWNARKEVNIIPRCMLQWLRSTSKMGVHGTTWPPLSPSNFFFFWSPMLQIARFWHFKYYPTFYYLIQIMNSLTSDPLSRLHLNLLFYLFYYTTFLLSKQFVTPQ